MLFTALLENKK